jgi:plastocyanin
METIYNSSKRPLILFASLLILLSISYGCSKSNNSTPGPGANQVLIESSAFSPTTITVAVNTTITWTNKDAIAHTVTSDDGLFDSGNMNANSTYSRQFTTVGTFNYHCAYHSFMLAKVIVQ